MKPTDNINIVYVDINDLIPADYNPRKATEKEFDKLAENIMQFGFVDPVLANSNPARKNIVIGGHFRLRVAKKLGYTKVPVVYLDIADIEKEKELNVRLNKNTGTFDFEMLANMFEVQDLTDWGFSMGELGMSETENEEEKPSKNKEVDPGSLGEYSVITLKFTNDKYLEILDLFHQAKDGLGFETNEELIENLLKDNVQL